MREISGDENLNFKRMFLYLISNFFRGVIGHLCSLNIAFIAVPEVEEGPDSPSRKHLNWFVRNYLPVILPPGRIDILEIGVGSGYLLNLLATSGYSGRYVGVDVRRRKNLPIVESGPFDFEFVEQDFNSYSTDALFDLIISITVLEHMEQDRQAVVQAASMLKPGGVQVHIVPSFWSLFLFLTHGFRQYNPRRMLWIFKEINNVRFFRLGGAFSFLLHFFIITLPLFFFKSEKPRHTILYSKLTSICNRLDRLVPLCSSIYVALAVKDYELLPGK